MKIRLISSLKALLLTMSLIFVYTLIFRYIETGKIEIYYSISALLYLTIPGFIPVLVLNFLIGFLFTLNMKGMVSGKRRLFIFIALCFYFHIFCFWASDFLFPNYPEYKSFEILAVIIELLMVLNFYFLLKNVNLIKN